MLFLLMNGNISFELRANLAWIYYELGALGGCKYK